MGDHHHADLRQHGADDALGAVFARPRGGGACLDDLALKPLDLPAPPEIAAAHAEGQRQVEQHDDLPDGHQCTCSAGGATLTFSSFSAWTFCSSRSVPRGAASTARR